MKNIKISASDDYQLSLNIYDCKNPKGIIQIIHGMEEHQQRYKDFATYLSSNGFVVVTSNIRGHGHDCNELGYFKDKKGYQFVIDDQIKIKDYIKHTFPGVPLILFGHSMGSMIARIVLQTESKEYTKAILCGYPNYQGAAHAGKLISNIIKLFKGPKHDSKLLQNMTTGSFNKSIKNPKTQLDWLSYNEENVTKYIEDEYCGFNFTTSAYNDLFHFLTLMHNHKLYKNINENLEFLLIAGKDDPCTGGEKGTLDSIKVLNKAGFSHIKRIDYDNMRHEILNEKEYEKVYKDVLEFLK